MGWKIAAGHPRTIMLDTELLAFLRERQHYLGRTALHAAVEKHFPPYHVPSVMTIGKYLAVERRAGADVIEPWGGPRRAVPLPKLDTGPTRKERTAAIDATIKPRRGRLSRLQIHGEVGSFIRTIMHGRTIDQVREACLARFPADRVPSRSGIGRFVRAERGGAKKAMRLLRGDAELVTFVRENVARMTLDDLRAACEARFPDRKPPSRSMLGRAAVKMRGRKGSGQPSTIEDNIEVEVMVRALAGKVPIDAIHAACKAAYPETTFSRSALHRFVQAELQETYGEPAAPPRRKAAP